MTPLKLGSNIDLGKVVRNLGAKAKLVPHLDRAIAEGDFVWEYQYEPKRSDDAWHPSGDCTPSLHDLYLKATGRLEQKPFSVGLLKTFQVGHFWHQYLQWLVQHKLGFADKDAIERRGATIWDRDGRKSGNIIAPNIAPGEPYHWATGSGDVAPCTIPGQGEFLIDFKTQNSRDFRRTGLPDWCVEKYEAQINIYMGFFDIERALIVCIEKDNPHDLKEIEYERNQPLIDAVYAKWRLVSQCLDEGIEPPENEEFHLPFKGAVAS